VHTDFQVAPYLLQRGLVDPASIVAGDLTILDVSRRNQNFKVISARGPSYLLKRGISPDRAATVAREAAVYELLQSDTQSQCAGFSRYLPKFYCYDSQERLLTLELVRDAEDFRQYQARRRHFSTRLAAMMGKALGALHSVSHVKKTYQGGFSLQQQMPWVLKIHRPHLGILRDVSEANLRLIGIVQQSAEFCRALDDLRRDWSNDRIVHHDIKWDNWLISARSSQPGSRLKLVDWELAALGDPCWDVGSVFSGYLSFWLSSVPITGGEPPERFLELSRYPLDSMQPALRSFWSSYVMQMSLDASAAAGWLLRAMRYGAARLVQTAFEHMQRSNQLTGNTVCLLQLSLNVMMRPHEAVVQLLGIPLSSEDGA
jgi:hypothetical protein